MRINKDKYNVYEDNEMFSLSVFSTVGDRVEQQDSAGYKIGPAALLVAVCDGMGGHSSGKEASSQAVDVFMNSMEQIGRQEFNYSDIIESVERANKIVCGISTEDGKWAMAGSTLVAADIENYILRWVSIGDSRIYLLRGEEFIQLSEDQKYEIILKAQLNTGEISREEYEERKNDKEKLVNFIGIGENLDTSKNIDSKRLMPGDKILLETDGLYRLLPDDEVKRVLINFSNPSDALDALEYKVRYFAKNSEAKRDNMTLALIYIK